MTIREISQLATLIMSSLSFSMSLIGMYLRPERRWILSVAGLYASLDVVFYILVIVFRLRSIGNELSPYRVVMQNAILLAIMYRYLRGDFKGWIRKWK